MTLSHPVYKNVLDASKEIILHVNADKTKNMFIYRYQTAIRNHNIKTADKLFENVAKFK
jgi:hypothetical protein